MAGSIKAPKSAMQELVHSSLIRVENILIELSKTAVSVEPEELPKKETSKDVSKKVIKTQKGIKKTSESSKYMTNVSKPQVRSEYAKQPLVSPPKLVAPKPKMSSSDESEDDFDWKNDVGRSTSLKDAEEARIELEKQVLNAREIAKKNMELQIKEFEKNRIELEKTPTQASTSTCSRSEGQTQKNLEFQKKKQEKTRMELERATTQASTSSSARSEENGIVVDVNLKVCNPNEEKKMNMSIECPDFTPKRIYFDGKWREIRLAE